jgi:LacI family transcriptional regulator
MTLEQVAKKAGVSTATVSRVMNNPALVREETRERVLAAAKELRYRPNRHAQSLAAGRSRTIGMIVSNIENPYFLDVLHGLEEVATESGYEVVYENTGYRAERLAAAVDLMLSRPLAGLAVIGSERDDHAAERLRKWDKPVVVSDLCGAEGNVTRIRIRYEHAMQATVEYLYALGHRRMAFVCHHGSLDALRAREHAFESTVGRFPDVLSRTEIAADGPHGGRQATNALLGSGFRPTAVLCVNDFMAIGVLRALRDAGLRAPDDVSVTGFDNIELSEYLIPSLTTADIPRRRIGRTIFEVLAGGPGKEGREILIEPRLVFRESTGPTHS